MAGAAQPELLIGEIAERAGVDRKTIRYYEQVRLLPTPARSESGYRLYRELDAERLRFIKGVKRLGFSLGEIREILALRDRGRAPCSYVAERLELRSREVDRQLEELMRLKGELARLSRLARRVAADEPPADGYCHILRVE